VSAVSLLYAVVLSLTLGQCASFSSLVYGDCVRLLRLTFGTVRDDFFGRLHAAFHSADSLYNNQHKHIKIIITKIALKNLEPLFPKFRTYLYRVFLINKKVDILSSDWFYSTILQVGALTPLTLATN